MSGARINFELEGAGALERAFRRLLRTVGPEGRHRILDRAGRRLETSTRHRFELGEAPDGTAWKKSWRAKKEGGVTLTDSARLRDSITSVASGDELRVGTNVLYGAIHQFGGVIRPVSEKALRFHIGEDLVIAQSVTMPARPFLGITRSDERAMLRIAEQALEEAV